MHVSKIYNKAADLIKKGWVQKSFAESSDGKRTHPCRDNAERWCLSGALIAAVYLVEGDRLGHCPARLIDGLMLEDNMILWNDYPDRTKGEVVTLLQNAAARSLLLKGDGNDRRRTVQ